MAPSPTTLTNKNPKLNEGNLSRYSQWMTDWFTDWWGLEILCWAISALSVVAIVIVLESHKNRALPEWPFEITINSLISIFATLGQMAMMNPVVECISQLKWLWFDRRRGKLIDFQAFDNASRGPTGSLILIGKLRGLNLVILGAAITVCSTAFGAFAQQIVTYPLRAHPFGNATTPFVFNLTGNSASILESEIQNAVANGVAANGSIAFGITPNCSTGNCTWTEYHSLGICASANDISSSISKNVCDLATLNKFFRKIGLENPGYPCFNYTLPFQVQNIVESSNSIKYSYGNATLTNLVPLLGGPESMQFLTLESSVSNSSLIDAYIIYQPDIIQSFNSSLTSPLAYHFNFKLCIQTFSTIVINGLASTTLVSSQPFDTSVIEVENGVRGFSVFGNNTYTTSVHGVNFTVARHAITSFVNIFTADFLDNCYISLNQTLTEEFYSTTGGLYCASSNMFATFFSQGAVISDPLSVANQLSQQIATSLTNTLLYGASGEALTTPFLGTAFSPQTFVGTNYFWLIFPVALILLTFIFLLATILKSQRLGSKAWKSSTIAMLQGLDARLHAHLGGLTSVSEIEEKAKLAKVEFSMKQGEGGRFEEATKNGPPKRK